MDQITNRSVEEYMEELIPPRDAVLEEMEQYAKENRVPIVGPVVGRVLYQLARSVNARRVFEMGSAIGYSTIWFARAVSPEGKVYYTDGTAANAAKADSYAKRGGVRDRMEILTGN